MRAAHCITALILVAGLVLPSFAVSTGSSLLPDGFDAKPIASSKSPVANPPQKILSAEGLAFKDNLKVELGEGHGDTYDEALQEAMKDVLQKVVGVYVDSDFRMNNDEIIKDEIITHSNGFIDHYKKIEESTDSDGRGKVVSIRAWVKMRDFVNRMKKIAPSQTVKMDGAILDNDLSNAFNAEALLKKELENLNPAMDLMDVKLVDGIRPAVRDTTDDAVTLRYVFQMSYSTKKYDKFLSRLTSVLDQIAEVSPRNLTVDCEVAEARLFPYISWSDAWKACPVKGLFRRQKDLCYKPEHCVRAVVVANSGSSIKVREWKLSERLFTVYEDLSKKCTERSKNISCNLSLADAGGNILSQGSCRIAYSWYFRFYTVNSGRIDFAPYVTSWSDNETAELKDGDEWQRYRDPEYAWYDKYIGCIDITIDRKDVAKIKSAKVSLETSD